MTKLYSAFKLSAVMLYQKTSFGLISIHTLRCAIISLAGIGYYLTYDQMNSNFYNAIRDKPSAATYIFLIICALIFWHLLLIDLIIKPAWLPAKWRLVIIRSIDYIWLGSAAIALLFNVSESRHDYLLKAFDFVDVDIMQDLAAIKENGQFPFQKSCKIIDRSSDILVKEYKLFCNKYSNATGFSDKLKSDAAPLGLLLFENDSLYSENEYGTELSGALNRLAEICSKWNAIGYKKVELHRIKNEIENLNGTPGPRSDRWLALFVIAMALRLTRTTAEIAEIFWVKSK